MRFQKKLLAVTLMLPSLSGELSAATVFSSITPLVINNGDSGQINLNASLGAVNDATIDLFVDVVDLGSNSVMNLRNGASAEIATVGGASTDAQRFIGGESVGPTLTFIAPPISSRAALDNATLGLSLGDWGGGESGYVGVQFSIAGADHYGFVRVSWFPDNDVSTTSSLAVIDQIGYNTVAGDPATIPTTVVPEPSSTLLLLLGGLPLVFFRRK